MCAPRHYDESSGYLLWGTFMKHAFCNVRAFLRVSGYGD